MNIEIYVSNFNYSLFKKTFSKVTVSFAVVGNRTLVIMGKSDENILTQFIDIGENGCITEGLTKEDMNSIGVTVMSELLFKLPISSKSSLKLQITEDYTICTLNNYSIKLKYSFFDQRIYKTILNKEESENDSTINSIKLSDLSWILYYCYGNKFASLSIFKDIYAIKLPYGNLYYYHRSGYNLQSPVSVSLSLLNLGKDYTDAYLNIGNSIHISSDDINIYTNLYIGDKSLSMDLEIIKSQVRLAEVYINLSKYKELVRLSRTADFELTFSGILNISLNSEVVSIPLTTSEFSISYEDCKTFEGIANVSEYVTSKVIQSYDLIRLLTLSSSGLTMRIGSLCDILILPNKSFIALS